VTLEACFGIVVEWFNGGFSLATLRGFEDVVPIQVVHSFNRRWLLSTVRIGSVEQEGELEYGGIPVLEGGGILWKSTSTGIKRELLHWLKKLLLGNSLTGFCLGVLIHLL